MVRERNRPKNSKRLEERHHGLRKQLPDLWKKQRDVSSSTITYNIIIWRKLYLLTIAGLTVLDLPRARC